MTGCIGRRGTPSLMSLNVMTSLNVTVLSIQYVGHLSQDRIARLILHILFLENSKSVTLILTGVGGGWGGGLHCAKFSSSQKMNQIGDKVRK